MDFDTFDSIRLFLIYLWILITTGIATASLLTYSLREWPWLSSVRKLVFYGKFSMLERCNTEQLNSVLALFNRLVGYLEVPKSSFRHFYVFSLFINCFVFTLLLNISTNDDEIWSISTVVFLFAQVVQSLRRIYETNFVSIYSDNQINVIHYIVGMFFYATVGYATLDSILLEGSLYQSDSLLSSIYFPLVTFGTFAMSSYIQYDSHRILASLRKQKMIADGSDDARQQYFMPQGGLFSLISCPHYLTEIIIYICLYCLSGWTHLWASLCVFVIVNQTIAALLAHAWYRNKFGCKYPQSTKALIPYLL